MKNIFVVNPAAGNRRGNESFVEHIKEAASKAGADFAVYRTKCVGDAETFVRRLCQSESGEKLRFFACGGDGTLNEVVNGAFGFDCVEIGCIPIGTGNDFVRNFPEAGDFMDIEAQLGGRSRQVDLIRYDRMVDGQTVTKYCANMFNIGFDCNVVDVAAKLKTYPLISGSLAYLLGILVILIKKKGADLRIEFTDDNTAEGQRIHDRKILLVATANGCFCGGGIKGVPLAAIDDGFIDVSIIEDIPRRAFATLLPKYAKGIHMETRAAENLITYRKCKSLAITVNRHPERMSVDGEIIDITQVRFQNLPGAMVFSVPGRQHKNEITIE